MQSGSRRFSRQCRVRKRREFQQAQRRGRRISCPHFVLLVASRSAAGLQSRLGLVASRKVGSAVVRNRGKRLVREWFRHRQAELPASIDLLVILRKGAGDLDLSAVVLQLDRVLPSIAALASRLEHER